VLQPCEDHHATETVHGSVNAVLECKRTKTSTYHGYNARSSTDEIPTRRQSTLQKGAATILVVLALPAKAFVISRSRLRVTSAVARVVRRRRWEAVYGGKGSGTYGAGVLDALWLL
jgi:hypothetical protein